MKVDLAQSTILPTEIQGVSSDLERMLEQMILAYGRRKDFTMSDRTICAYGLVLETLNRVAFSKLHSASAGVLQRGEHAAYNLCGVLGDQAGVMMSPFGMGDRMNISQNLVACMNEGAANPTYLVDAIEIPPERMS